MLRVSEARSVRYALGLEGLDSPLALALVLADQRGRLGLVRSRESLVPQADFVAQLSCERRQARRSHIEARPELGDSGVGQDLELLSRLARPIQRGDPVGSRIEVRPVVREPVHLPAALGHAAVEMSRDELDPTVPIRQANGDVALVVGARPSWKGVDEPVAISRVAIMPAYSSAWQSSHRMISSVIDALRLT